MKTSKKPHIQEAWQKFKEIHELEMNELDFKTIVFMTCELVWWIIPYILATWQMNIMTPPRKHSHKRRIHRNI